MRDFIRLLARISGMSVLTLGTIFLWWLLVRMVTMPPGLINEGREALLFAAGCFFLSLIFVTAIVFWVMRIRVKKRIGSGNGLD
jgi:hypothetical protein